MTSSVEIANMALSTYIGSQRINDMDEQSAAALQIRLHFGHVRRELLQRWPFSFARRRVALARTTGNDRPEWRSRFSMPPKVMGIRWVNDPQTAKDAISLREIYDTPRDIVDGFVYSDLEAATMEYIFEQEDATTYSEQFVQAFAATLASKIAMTLRESASAAQNAQEAAAAYLDEAKVYDARLHPPIRVVHMVNWAEVR